MNSHLIILLREFRDRLLLTNPLGEGFRQIYYAYSPPLAARIFKHEMLGKVNRCTLLPFAAMAYMTLHLHAEVSLLSLAAFLTILRLTMMAIRKRRARRTVAP